MLTLDKAIKLQTLALENIEIKSVQIAVAVTDAHGGFYQSALIF